MEKFLSLPAEKQQVIIDAALKCFGTNGYKKTSVSDIAVAAGISKAMVFHYFGTKKALFLYLVELCGTIIINEVNEKFDNSVTDFFDRIALSSDIELSVMRKHPALLTFISKAYFETDTEVKADVMAMVAQGEGFRNKIAFDNTDFSKFKEDVDPKHVMKMLTWMAEGFSNHLSVIKDLDLDAMMEEFYECMNLLRNNFYKEEYVTPKTQK